MAISSSAVDGLVSGLDTASIISQLIAVDSAPQTALKNNVTAAQSKVTAYQSVNAKMSALETAAATLQTGTAWTAAKATTVGDGVTATADASATPASLSFKVTQLAAARSVISDPIAANADITTIKTKLSMPMDVVRNGAVVGTINPQSGTIEEVAAAINKIQGLGLTAVAIKMGDDNYRVQITSTSTGETSGDFKLVPWQSGQTTPYNYNTIKNDLDTLQSSKFSVTSLAANAKIELPVAAVAGNSQPPITIASQTNTFSGLMKGVSVTATQVTAGNSLTTVNVATDTSAVTASVKAVVDAANAALTEIASQSKAGVVGASGSVTGAGVLRGDSTLRALQSSIINSVTTALGGTESAAKYGVQTTRDGKLTFTEATFSAAYAANPVATQKAFSPKSYTTTILDKDSDGLADRLAKLSKTATDTYTGTLTTAITGQNDSISDLTKRIADWDVRLADKKARYQKYYSSLEVSLGKLQSQSTWLSGQLASLSGSNS